MEINIVTKTQLVIGMLKKGDTFTWCDKQEDIFMIIEGEGIQPNNLYKHAVNLRTGSVIEPGVACCVLRVNTSVAVGEVVY